MMSTKPATTGVAVKQIQHLKFEVAYRARLQKICNRINAAEDLDEIFELCDRIAVMFRGEFMGVLEADDPRLKDIGLMMAGSMRL